MTKRTAPLSWRVKVFWYTLCDTHFGPKTGAEAHNRVTILEAGSSGEARAAAIMHLRMDHPEAEDPSAPKSECWFI